MKPARLWHYLLQAQLVAVIFVLFCYISFPVARIEALISKIVAGQGLKLNTQISKMLLPGLAFKRPVLSSEQGELFRCESLQARVLLLPLLTGRLETLTDAVIGKGHIICRYAVNGKKALKLEAGQISLDDIPFFKNVLGATVTGNLWSSGEILRDAKAVSGDIKLEIKQLGFSGVRLGSFQLPDAAGLKAQGLVRAASGKLRLESLTLEGEGLYMRLSGDIPSNTDFATAPLQMNLEIMPKADFLEKQRLVFMLLAKFMTSPGVYSIPIRGTLLKPVIL